MKITGFWLVLLMGCFGAILAEILRWYQLRQSPNLPEYIRSPFYWLITIMMIICSGILATLYGVTNVNALQVVNVGASAPLIISSIARTSSSTIPKERGRDYSSRNLKASVINFLSGC